MKPLPTEAIAYKQTPIFTQATVPDALQNRHSTKPEVWGKICVLSGQLSYYILPEPSETHILTPESPGVIEPQIPHYVTLMDDVEFFVEFYRIAKQ